MAGNCFYCRGEGKRQVFDILFVRDGQDQRRTCPDCDGTGLATLSPRKRELARHALGLPNDNKKSYRNRFYASAGHADFENWSELVLEGLAGEYKGMFYLTRDGASLALDTGESLCPEDFPAEAA